MNPGQSPGTIEGIDERDLVQRGPGPTQHRVHTAALRSITRQGAPTRPARPSETMSSDQQAGPAASANSSTRRLPRLPSVEEWKRAIAPFQRSSNWRATWQLINTVGPYIGLWVAMRYVAPISLWLALPLAILAGLFQVRVFILFHDCCHGSFFRNSRANDWTGSLTGLLTFTPYHQWRYQHSVHHATSGHLEQRGVGDVWTMTVSEYLGSSRLKRFGYRLTRNPFVLFVVAPIYLFVFKQRFGRKGGTRRETLSVWRMNAALAVLAVGMAAWVGWANYLVLQSVAITVAGAAGIWLFYVQHQFEEAYWERGEEWDYTAAALQGSSFYKLPAVLRWLSGNIGYHHIHHLSPRVPNYRLVRCHSKAGIFDSVKPLTFWRSFQSLRMHLWDEGQRRLISFRQVHSARRRLLG